MAGSTTMRVWAAHQRWTKKQIHDCVDQTASHFLGLIADKVSFFESAKKNKNKKQGREDLFNNFIHLMSVAIIRSVCCRLFR